MRRHELTDEEWAAIQPLLPNKPRGVLMMKIHALVDAKGRPVRLALTAGQAGDAPAA